MEVDGGLIRSMAAFLRWDLSVLGARPESLLSDPLPVELENIFFGSYKDYISGLGALSNSAYLPLF